jgi:hypothetical protein
VFMSTVVSYTRTFAPKSTGVIFVGVGRGMIAVGLPGLLSLGLQSEKRMSVLESR